RRRKCAVGFRVRCGHNESSALGFLSIFVCPHGNRNSHAGDAAVRMEIGTPMQGTLPSAWKSKTSMQVTLPPAWKSGNFRAGDAAVCMEIRNCHSGDAAICMESE